MIFPARRAWTILTGSKLNSRRLARRAKGMDARSLPGERTATGMSHGRVARKNRENEEIDTLQKAKSWGRPCRPGDKFPWEASGTADLKVVYRKQNAIKLWGTNGDSPAIKITTIIPRFIIFSACFYRLSCCLF